MIDFTVLSVNISEVEETAKIPADSIELEQNHRISGDSHAGNWYRQIYLLGIEDIDIMRKDGYHVNPGDFAENITTRGIKLYKLPVGSMLHIGNAVLEVTRIGKMFRSESEVMENASTCIISKRGIYAKVIRGGIIKPFMNGTAFEYENEKTCNIDVKSYSKMVSTGLYRDVYRTIAREIIDVTKVVNGIALDIGSGPGPLGIALAEMTNLDVTLYDPLNECLGAAMERVRMERICGRINVLQGTAESIVVKDNTIDLVVSRGSIFFWNDRAKGLAEVYRVLKKGGWAYIGGGYGTEEMKKKVEEQNGNLTADLFRRSSQKESHYMYYHHLLSTLGIPGMIECREGGLWIIIRK